MLGDILLIEDKHRVAGEAIIQKILERKTEKFIIGISGESGSGKSELAHVIAKGLRKHGIMAKPIHIDNYYRIHPLERTEWRKKNGIGNVVGYGEYDWDTIYQNIDDFKNSRKSTMPCVDLVNGIDMLVVDGLYAIKTEGVDLKVFLELTYHETKKAQVIRGKEPQNDYRMAVLEQEHRMVQALKPKADILISKEYEVLS
jgi:uridine kinase